MSSCINLFALHYFLWFGALTSIYGYISVYAEHYANASSSQYGLLNMILPFVTIGSKLFSCSLADRHRAWKSFFVAFLVLALIGYGSFGILPFFIAPPPKEEGLNHATWAIICLMTSIATISMSVVSCLSDAFAMNSSRKHSISYGFIRVWGTLGWGASSFIVTFINQSTKLPLLVPGLFLLIALIGLDIAAVIFWPHKDDFNLDRSSSDHVNLDAILTNFPRSSTNLRAGVVSDELRKSTYGTAKEPIEQRQGVGQQQQQQQMQQTPGLSIQWELFKEVAKRRKSMFRYMILFTISGALISLQWSYFFVYLNKIYPEDFSFISGLSMVAQSMLGELPFFILSDYVIKILGRSHTLSISIMTIGIRYLMYQYLLSNGSMYLVLLTETFQGPSFGLFYVVMTEVGLEYSSCEEAIVSFVERQIISNEPEQMHKLRQTLRATMQSLMSACYEGLGLGIGSIVGGLVIDYYGFDTLWTYSAILAIGLASFNILIEHLGLPILVDKKSQLVALQT